MKLKLYRVTCKGMTSRFGTTWAHGIGFVVAPDESTAYAMMRSRLDARGLGFASERALDKIELLAEVGGYSECGTTLYLPESFGP